MFALPLHAGSIARSVPTWGPWFTAWSTWRRPSAARARPGPCAASSTWPSQPQVSFPARVATTTGSARRALTRPQPAQMSPEPSSGMLDVSGDAGVERDSHVDWPPVADRPHRKTSAAVVRPPRSRSWATRPMTVSFGRTSRQTWPTAVRCGRRSPRRRCWSRRKGVTTRPSRIIRSESGTDHFLPPATGRS
jgi:hypothetical protein